VVAFGARTRRHSSVRPPLRSDVLSSLDNIFREFRQVASHRDDDPEEKKNLCTQSEEYAMGSQTVCSLRQHEVLPLANSIVQEIPQGDVLPESA
jgi:hypothetical protein